MVVNLHNEALDELNSEDAKALHELMDSLSSCGVDKLVSLPRIIVVGEQSAGKSSVLEAISRVKFPVAGGVCTRFATEIVLRTAAETRVKVSITFDDRTKGSKQLKRAEFSSDDLSDIIKEARGYMGIPENSREFSKDVLRLEIEGPDMRPLTLVDLPGMFHAETDSQSLQGREVVNQLIESYVKQKNSIILVVVEANRQLAHDVALAKIWPHDPKRERTIGVITKPDLAAISGTEKEHIRLAKNEEVSRKLKLGWHVLRNRANDEQTLAKRDEAEEMFFKQSAWREIPRTDRGIANLRKKLAKELYEHTRSNLPGVLEDIETNLDNRQDELNRLGLARSSTQEMRSFLIQIASEFQRLTRDGISGSYSDAFFSHIAEPRNRLRADLKGYYLAFEYTMASKGHEVSIQRNEYDKYNDEGKMPASVANFLATHPLSPAPKTPRKMDLKEMNALLEKFAAQSIGRELPGVCNSELVVKLFQWQAQPWEAIARAHIQGVMAVAKNFTEALVIQAVGGSDTHSTAELILAEFVDPFFEETKKRLDASLAELLWPYKEGHAVPMDEEFRKIVLNWKIKRIAKQVQKIPASDLAAMGGEEGKFSMAATKVYSALAVALGTSSGTFSTDDDIDMMQAYYEMSRRTFTDNIINIAIERGIVRHLPTIFDPYTVGKLTDKRIQELAAESEQTQARRVQLTEEIATLRKGLEKCRRWKPRHAKSQAAIAEATNTETPASSASNSGSNLPDRRAENAASAAKSKGSIYESTTLFPSVTPAAKPFASLAGASTLGRSAASPSPSQKPETSGFSFASAPSPVPPIGGSSSSGSGGLFGNNAVPKPTGIFGELHKTPFSTTKAPSSAFSSSFGTGGANAPTNGGGLFGGTAAKQAQSASTPNGDSVKLGASTK